MPSQFNDYYEPFLGSGAVLANLQNCNLHKLYPKFNKAYGSDILPFLIDLFEIVRDSPEKMVNYYDSEVNKYRADADYYNVIRDRFNKNPNPYDFCVLSRTCYSGVIRFRKADGYMSTPRGPHVPISTKSFQDRVNNWSSLIKDVEFTCEPFQQAMKKADKGDIVYCDPPYTHSQTILYGGQNFNIKDLWRSIDDCKSRGATVILSINGKRNSGSLDISCEIPDDLFSKEYAVDCGKSMIERLHREGSTMDDSNVYDRLLVT